MGCGKSHTTRAEQGPRGGRVSSTHPLPVISGRKRPPIGTQADLEPMPLLGSQIFPQSYGHPLQGIGSKQGEGVLILFC
jgi:hypothetical protein